MVIDPIISKNIVIAPKKLDSAKNISSNENFVRQLSITIVGD
jgi:hypothetical protein